MSVCDKPGRVASGVRVCSTAKACLNEVLEQIEFDCFSESQIGDAERIARVIAEVYSLPAESMIRIDGNSLNASFVASMYEEIENEDVVNVIAKMKNTGEIKFLKSYIRTALYNAVVEK